MVDFLPSTVDSVADEERDPRVVGVDSEDADKLLSALSSKTGRNILSTLYEEPATPATIAERVDTSLQNVRYHLEKLEDGNLIEVADTAYSEKGREMKVYAPTAGPLVLFAGNEDDTVGLESALSNLLGGLGILGVASLVVQRLATGGLFPFPFSTTSNGDSDGGYQGGDSADSGADGNSNLSNDSTTAVTTDSADETVTVTESVPDSGTEAATRTSETTETAGDATTTTLDQTTDVVQETTTTTVQTIAEGSTTAGVPPGLLFFLGGALILALGFVVWYVRVYRKSA
ncbi:Helix-turn-helix domain-containing protein [Haladaptatus litoreus]|uniref:Helix-turn-helix domain-containing protein n=1 Tax=Haladaptatus litoreus TaxID=553468 RepID=A0A1N6X4H9_9EURY|nr:helix-turn-helix domain-containing protein [Haladaptatus litoreus]SIQ97225.1 Helix-turn-helix domain-containing protein [Haladaptatus litoreus]